MLDLESIQLKVRHCRHREDAPGTSWGPRTNPDYELLLIEKGRYSYCDAAGKIHLSKNQLLLIEPAVEHTFEKDKPHSGSHFSAHFNLVDLNGSISFLDQLNCPERNKTMSAPPTARDVFKLASDQFTSHGRFSSEAVNSAIRSLWLVFAASWFGPTDTGLSDRMREMMDYLRNHLDLQITRIDLAKKFHCSPEHVNYLFKKELNETPSHFLNRERVFKAFQLMKDDGLNVQEAALATGFSNQYYFSRVFKKYFDFPPSYIRKYQTGEIDRIFKKTIPES